MSQHILHIEDEGFETSAVGSRHRMRPYCECGWLGDTVRSFDDPRQLCREQFYVHLQTFNDRTIPGAVI